jgi:hypothetical protein
MGLDMYLHATKHVSGLVLTKPDGPIDEQYKDPLFDPLKGLIGDIPCSGFAPSMTLEVKVAYWRKANQIHRWFVTNVQEGVDECQQAYVDRGHLEELRDLCQKILDESDKAKQRALIEADLPPQGGFFFGSTDVDDDEGLEDYLQDLTDTVEQLTAALDSETIKASEGIFGWTFYYQSSW